jgi:hypothetical protein
VGHVKLVADRGFVFYCCINFTVFLFIMASMAILPEYLLKDELQYELEARGVSTAGLDVAALRSIFRKSRHLKEDSVVLGNTDLLLDHEAVLVFCQDRLYQIKDLVENTDVFGSPLIFRGIFTDCDTSLIALVTFCSMRILKLSCSLWPRRWNENCRPSWRMSPLRYERLRSSPWYQLSIFMEIFLLTFKVGLIWLLLLLPFPQQTFRVPPVDTSIQ